MDEYVQKRSKDAKRLDDFDLCASMGDFAMVYCQKLKDVPGTTFKELYWIAILELLDAEKYAHLSFHFF